MSRPPSGPRLSSEGVPTMPPISQAQGRPPSNPSSSSRRSPLGMGAPAPPPVAAPPPPTAGPSQPTQLAFDPVAKLAELERRMREDRNELLNAREELRKKRDQEFIQREQDLRGRLEGIARTQEEEREDRARVKERILALQREVERRKEREQELEQRALAMAREEREEQVARWVARWQILNQSRREADAEMRRRANQLEAVRSELARRDAEQVAAMRQAMERRNMGPLPAALSQAGLPAAVDRALEAGDGGRPGQEPGLRVIDQLMAQRAGEREARLREAQERVKALNGRRGELLSELEKLEGERRVHAALAAKGGDFLLELELGEAPPRDYVLANVRKQVAEGLGGEPPPGPPVPALAPKELARAVEAALPEAERRLAALRAEAEALRARVPAARPYRGELGPLSYSLQQRPTYYMLKEVTEEIADGMWDWVQRHRVTRELLGKQRAEWEAGGRDLERFLEEQRRTEAERAILADALAETIGELGAGVHAELRAAFDFSDALVHSVLARALLGACGKPNADDATTVKMLRELRRKRDETAARRQGPLELYRHTLRLQPSPQATKAQQTEEERRKAEEDAKKKKEEEAAWVDPEASVVRWEETEARIPGFGADEHVSREVAYFERIAFRPFTLRCEADGHSVARGSPNGRLLALGGVAGGVWVYDLALAAMLASLALTDRKSAGGATVAGRECLLRRPRKGDGGEERARVVEIAWSADGTGLLSLTRGGFVRLYSIAPDPAAPRDSVPEDGSYVPPPLWPLVELSSRALGTLLVDVFADEAAAEGQKKTKRFLGIRIGEEEDEGTAPGRPACLAFHPALTLMATQPAFVCGTRGGDVVKSNTLPLRKLIYGAPPPGDRTQRASFAAVKGAGGFLSSHEVFTGHRVEVRLVGFRQHTTDMVTVDARGHIFLWKYVADALSFFGCFTPVAKFRLDTTYHTFAAAGAAQAVFPPRMTYVPDRVEPGSGFERAMKAEVERVARLELAPRPHLALKMGAAGKEYVFPLRADVEAIEGRRRRRREAAAAARAKRAAGLEPDEALLAILREAEDDGSGGEGGPPAAGGPSPSAPEGPPKREFTFHRLGYNREGDLVKHDTQRFRPCTVTGELVDCRMTRERDAVALTVRFGAHGEESTCLSTVLFDLDTLALRPRRLDVKPSPKPPPSAYANIGQPHPCPPFGHSALLRPLGSAAAYVAGEGCLKAYSLHTGAALLVAAAGLDDPEADEVSTVEVVGRHRFVAVAYSNRRDVRVVRVEDGNLPPDQREDAPPKIPRAPRRGPAPAPSASPQRPRPRPSQAATDGDGAADGAGVGDGGGGGGD